MVTNQEDFTAIYCCEKKQNNSLSIGKETAKSLL